MDPDTGRKFVKNNWGEDRCQNGYRLVDADAIFGIAYVWGAQMVTNGDVEGFFLTNSQVIW